MLMLCFGESSVSMNNQQCIARPMLIDLDLNELYC